jgi:hypothetical protein
VLAEGQFRVAYYYYLKGDRRAAAGRLMPLVRRYPLYSKSDTALWMLGDIFEKSERKDLAGSYYAQIVKNYPLSIHDADAKAKLKQYGMPVPQPDPKALEWMTAEQNTPRPKENIVHKSVGMLHGGPDVHAAAAHGMPNMEPDTDQGGDLLAGAGNKPSLGMGTATGSNAVVQVVTPGEPAPAGNTNSEDVNATTGDAPAATTPSAPNGATAAPAEGTPASATAQDPPASGDTAATDTSKSDNTQATSSDSSQNQNQNGKESSSKKKGIRKILPW